MDFESRKLALAEMAGQLEDASFSRGLVDAYMKDTLFLKRDIYSREIEQPVRLLKEVGTETDYTKMFQVDLHALRPLGNIAVLLPKNGINLLVSKAISSSFLAGNKTIVKLPGKLTSSYSWYRQLIERYLPGVSFASPAMSSATFLAECIASPDIQAIVVYGDDRWIWSYKDQVKRSGTKFIFEGPGKDPQIVMPDADLDLAVADAVKGGLLNGGQSCSAMERFFVHSEIEQEFITRLADHLGRLKIGAPEKEDTDIGPIYSPNVLNRLTDQVQDAAQRGADIVMGGRCVQVNGSGNYSYEPTIVRNCNKSMKIFREENFGPVFPVMSFSSEQDLLSKVDDTDYGLNASLYGTCPPAIGTYLNNSHRNIYFNSTVTTECNTSSRILDGGYKNSGLIWEWRGDSFIQREGRRLLLKELSYGCP